MSALVISRVTALPPILEVNTLYIVKAPGSAEATLTFVGNSLENVGHTLTLANVETLIANALATASSIVVVGTIPEMNALTPEANTLAYVMDTSFNPQANGGAGAYVYSVATGQWLPLPGTMKKIVQWSEIDGRPTATPAQIDTAVAQSHTHVNKTVLDNIGADSEGLTYNGAPVANVKFQSGW